MRRVVLLLAFSAVLLVDIMFFPFAISLFVLGGAFASLGFGVSSVLATFWGLAIAVLLTWSTRALYQVVRRTRPSAA